MQGVPNSRVEQIRLESSVNIEKSILSYNQVGRQTIRGDFTDHGRNLVHTDLHLHEIIY